MHSGRFIIQISNAQPNRFSRSSFYIKQIISFERDFRSFIHLSVHCDTALKPMCQSKSDDSTAVNQHVIHLPPALSSK